MPRAHGRGVPYALAALLVVACASAGKRLEQGMTAEQSGRPYDAAVRYVQALKKDPALEPARTHLQETGGRAVTELVARADSADAAGRGDEAADRLRDLDDLRRDAARVGVELAAPADYATRRRVILDRAIDAALRRADEELDRGDHARSDGDLVHAAERFEPSVIQRATLASARYRTLVAWSEAEGATEHYRASHQHATDALALAPTTVVEPSALDRARQLQRVALERGTRRVALLPPWGTQAVRDRAPADLLAELSDALLLDRAERAPLFVAVLPSGEVQRELRRQGLARRTLATREAARFGRTVGADLVVVTELDTVSRAESGVKSTTVRARTRSGADTAYTVREGRDELTVRVSYAVVDVALGRAIDDGRESASESFRFRRASYAGDPGTLDLPRAARDLFDVEGISAAERDAVRSLAARLAARVSDAAFGKVLSRID